MPQMLHIFYKLIIQMVSKYKTEKKILKFWQNIMAKLNTMHKNTGTDIVPSIVLVVF